MKEHPILFSAPMVKALLEGRKTQTRRPLNPQPCSDYSTLESGFYHPTEVDKNGEMYPGDEIFGAWTDDGEYGWKCPYGQVGDRLWVRETFWVDDAEQTAVFYAATDCRSDVPLKPLIFMPRKFSRITLEITAERVQQVQEISRGDAISEGVLPMGGIMDDEPWCASIKDQEPMKYPQAAYGRLWDSINSKRGYSWASNPWVWVISFKVLPK